MPGVQTDEAGLVGRVREGLPHLHRSDQHPSPLKTHSRPAGAWSPQRRLSGVGLLSVEELRFFHGRIEARKTERRLWGDHPIPRLEDYRNPFWKQHVIHCINP